MPSSIDRYSAGIEAAVGTHPVHLVIQHRDFEMLENKLERVQQMKKQLQLPAAAVNISAMLSKLKEVKVTLCFLCVQQGFSFEKGIFVLHQTSVEDLSTDYRALEGTHQFLKRIVHPKRNPFNHPTEQEQAEHSKLSSAQQTKVCNYLMFVVYSGCSTKIIRRVAAGNEQQRPAS